MALVVFFSFLLLLIAVQGQLQEDVTVQCYSSAADCTSNTNGVSLAAIDCCNRTGGGYISHSSLAAQCSACVVLGFDQTCVHIGQSDAGRGYSFEANILFSTPGAPDVTTLDYAILREPAVPVNVIANYLSSDFSGQTDIFFLPERFSIRYVSQGDAVALQPTLSFDYLFVVETGPSDPAIPPGVVFVYRRLRITIEDIDTFTIGLEPPSVFLEGSDATAVIRREVVTYLAPFEVTVSPERYTGPLNPDEDAVGNFDEFNFTETRSVIFQPTTNIDEIFERVTFSMPRDNIVELKEFFIWRLSVNDSRVRLNPDSQLVTLDNQDVFNVGFRELEFTIREGEAAPLTIQQIGDETAGIDIGGFPEDRLQPVRLRLVSGNATNGSDFFLANTAPRFTYRANNTLNDTYTLITSFEDNLIEGNETIRVIILPGGDNVVQVQRDRQTATITIVDNDIGMLSLERGTYDVIENEGTVAVCAVLTGGRVLSTNTDINILARPNTALLRSDYITRGICATLPAFGNRTCGRFNIVNDLIRETLFENFTVEIFSISPENSGLTINRNPSFIRIQDDDQFEVRFAMGQATFSEGGGNQSITVILGGAQLSQEQTMEVYIDDGTSNGVSLGFVTFVTGAIPQNRTVVFPVVDNNIALEPDKHYLLRLRGIGNIGLGNPGTMNVTVEDDDVTQQLKEDEIVRCYRSAADCTSNTNGVSLAAIDCCNRTGGGYISHSSLNAVAQCGACIVVGFDQSRVHIGPNDAGGRYSFTADILLSTPGAPDVTGLDYTISRVPAMLVNVADYLSSDFTGQTNCFLPERFFLQYVSQGNGVALQPTLSFNYTIAAVTGPIDPAIPSGVVLVYRHLSITIDDIDTMSVRLQVCSFLVEGITAQVYIKRQKIHFLTPFEVTLSYKKYQDLRSLNQLGDFDNFNFSKQNVLFDPVQDKNVIVKPVSLVVPVDNVVELSEVFLMRISAASAHIKITGVTTYQFIVDSGDVFRIGIKDINISVMEGGTPVLTIQQIGDERGGEAIGGLPENKIQPIVLRHEGGNATRGGLQSDFSFNPTVPRLTYSVNNTLNDITFTPITSIDDNIIEGDETIRVIIVPGGVSNDPNDHNVQVELKWQTATITIIDNDSGVLSLERETYDVIENEGSVEVCAVLTGGVLSTDTVITLQARDNTAVWNSDYSTYEVRPMLKAFENRTCSRFNIINDAVKEELYENFKVGIVNVTPQNIALAIDSSQSTIRIQDDDY